MLGANEFRINKYKSENIIKRVGVYIRQKCILTRMNIGTKMGSINGEKIRINCVNVSRLVQLYDVPNIQK